MIWEHLDRFAISKSADSHAARASYLNKRLSEVSNHLELVFHRFISGERGLKRVNLYFNMRPLEPFDPFNSKNKATFKDKSDRITINGERIEVQPFVLPHFRKVSQLEWDRYAGPNGYLKSQGFYIYRSKRLIIWGTWLGLAVQTPRTQLSRVRIDIGNNLDAEWKIDIKKASAQLPYAVRNRLRELLVEIQATAGKPITGRGHIAINRERLPIWQREKKHDHVQYVVNPDHPIFRDFGARLDAKKLREFEMILEFIGSAIPVDAIYSDLAAEPEKVSGATPSAGSLEYAVMAVVKTLRAARVPDDSLRAILELSDPFRESWDQTAQLLETILEGIAQP